MPSSGISADSNTACFSSVRLCLVLTENLRWLCFWWKILPSSERKPQNSHLFGIRSLVCRNPKYVAWNSRLSRCSPWSTISVLWNELNRFAVCSLDDCLFLNTLSLLCEESLHFNYSMRFWSNYKTDVWTKFSLSSTIFTAITAI